MLQREFSGGGGEATGPNEYLDGLHIGPAYVHQRTAYERACAMVNSAGSPYALFMTSKELTAPWGKKSNALKQEWAPSVFCRREILLAAASLPAAMVLGCQKEGTSRMIVNHRPRNMLPQTDLSWLQLHDHFVATVGEHAGKGRALGPLLVLADATFQPHSRFPLHPHQEMEILSIVLRGELSHHGDQGHGATLQAKEAQLISARDGMQHAEGNNTDHETRMLQIWFRPTQSGGKATYFRRTVADGPRAIIAGDAEVPLRADAKVWWLEMAPQTPTQITIPVGRRGYLLAVDGTVGVGKDVVLRDGDGAELSEGNVALDVSANAAALLVEVGP